MLIVTANWGLGDGTLVPAVAAWHGELAAAIHRAAIRAGVCDDGSYRPIDRLDLVLAGDTFDWLVSAEWQAAVKPWHGGAAAREAAARIARRSIRAARRLLGPVIHWARHGLAVPAALRGRPGSAQVTIPVQVTLLSGDRDAVVEEHVGKRHAGQPVIVGSRWDDGRVSIRHGHDLDPACRGVPGRSTATDRQPTLAESIAVDLVGRFAATAPTVAGVARLVRSLAAAGTTGIPAAIATWLDRRADLPTAEAAGLADVWRRCVDAWWHAARRTVPSCEVEFDAVDSLAGWFTAAAAGSSGMPAGLGCLQPRPPRGSPGLVLGHLGEAAAETSVVCLAPGHDAGEPRRPHLFACPESEGWPRWRPIAWSERPAAVVAIHAVERTADGGRIVDAA